MAYTPPRTWSAGETVTASLMNAHVRDNLNAISQKVVWLNMGSPDAGVIGTGYQARVWIPFPCTIVGWTILSDAVGSAVVDIRKLSYPPSGSPASIAGGEKPTLSSAAYNQDLSLTTWTADVAANSILYMYVESATTVKQLSIGLTVNPK